MSTTAMSTAKGGVRAPTVPVKMSSSFATLPGETISNIAVRLGSDDCFALRLTCKDIEAKSLHEFATEYFSNKGFIFTTDSLKVLVHVAKSEKLRDYMHTVQIVTAWFPRRLNNCLNGCLCLGVPTLRQSEAYTDYVADQKKLKTSGNDKKMLADSFRHLHKLTTINIADRFRLVGKSVDVRGYNKVRRVTGQPPTTPTEESVDPLYLAWLAHVWKAVMVAIAQQPLPSLRELSVSTKFSRDGLNINDLNLSEKTIAGARRTFSTLKRLDLCIRGRTKVSASILANLRTFGSMLANLEDLRLSFDYSKPAALLDSEFLTDADVSKITTFHVDGLKTTSESLCSLLARMTALKEVFITWTNLIKGTWIDVLAALQKLSDLKHLHLQWLGEGNRKAYFLKQTNPIDDETDEDVLDVMNFMQNGHPPAGNPPAPAVTANNAAPNVGVEAPDTEWTDSEDDVSNESMPPLVADANSNLAHEEGPLAVDMVESDEEGEDDDDDDDDDDEYHYFGEDDDDTEDGVALLEAAFAPIINNAVPAPQPPEPTFKAPGHENYNERGYYVCLSGDDVAKYLPIFMEEYNLGLDFFQEGADAADFFFAMGGHAVPPPGAAQAGAGAPAGAAGVAIGNNVLNTAFAQLFGGAAVPPMPFGGGPGGHGHGG